MLISAKAFQKYQKSPGFPEGYAIAGALSCVKEPELITFKPQHIVLQYPCDKRNLFPLELTLTHSIGKTCQVTLNDTEQNTFLLPQDFEKLLTQLKCIGVDYWSSLGISKRDNIRIGALFYRLVECMWDLLLKFTGQDISGVALRNAAVLRAFLCEGSSYFILFENAPRLTFTKGDTFCITFFNDLMGLDVNDQRTLTTHDITKILRVLEAAGVYVLSYSGQTVLENIEDTRSTGFFSSANTEPVSKPKLEPQVQSYKVLITETYTQEAIIQASDATELQLKASELIKDHPQALSDNCLRTSVTVKRLS